MIAKPLRILVLLDSLDIPAWSWEMLQVVSEEGNGEIVQFVLNTTPKPSGKASSFLYRLYRYIDRKIFSTKNDAFSRRNILTIPGLEFTPIRKITPIQKKFSDWFQKDDIDFVREIEPDIILRLGFRILKGEILNVARYGVWSYHHGDADVVRGGPACFWEVMQRQATTGSVLQVLSDKLDGGRILYASWSHTDLLSVHRNAQKVYWKSLFFFPRILKFVAQNGFLPEEVKGNHNDTSKYFTPPSNLEMIWLGIRHAYRLVGYKLSSLIMPEPWKIYIGRRQKVRDFDSKSMQSIANPKGRYFADPFVWEKGGHVVIFFEDFEYANNKAVISAICIQEENLQGFPNLGGLVKSAQVVIHESYHLSYPYIFNHEDNLYLIPESAQSHKVTIYRCTDFPFRWERVVDLMEGLQGYDPSVIYHEDKWWLFMNQKPHQEASSFDELYLYFSDDLFGSQWQVHPMNPIVSDVRCSRPAGRLFFEEGVLYRPAQDSAKRYGHRIKLQRILVMNELEYREETVQVISPWEKGQLGTHTYNVSKNWMVLDCQSLF